MQMTMRKIERGYYHYIIKNEMKKEGKEGEYEINYKRIRGRGFELLKILWKQSGLLRKIKESA